MIKREFMSSESDENIDINYGLTELLIKIQTDSEHRAFCHEIASRRYEQRNTMISVPVKLLPLVVTSMLSIKLQQSGECSSENSIDLAAMIVSAVASAAAVFRDIMKYSESCEHHKTAFVSYGELSRSIVNFCSKKTRSTNEYEQFYELG